MKNHELMIQDFAKKLEEKHNLTEEQSRDIADTYVDCMLSSLLANGYALMTEDIRLEVVSIQKRNYVLKGKTYKSTRGYKIKASISDTIYDRIKGRYDIFRDDEDGEY